MEWLKFEKEMKKRIRNIDFGDYNSIIKAEYRMMFMRINDVSQSDETSFNVSLRLIKYLNEVE